MQTPHVAQRWSPSQSHLALRCPFSPYNSVVLQHQTPLHRPRARTDAVAQILQLLKPVTIQHQQLDGRGGQIRWNVHSEPAASEVTEMLYGMAKRKPAPLTLTPPPPLSSAASSSQG